MQTFFLTDNIRPPKKVIVWDVFYFHMFEYKEFCQSVQGVFVGAELSDLGLENIECKQFVCSLG